MNWARAHFATQHDHMMQRSVGCRSGFSRPKCKLRLHLEALLPGKSWAVLGKTQKQVLTTISNIYDSGGAKRRFSTKTLPSGVVIVTRTA